MIVRISGEGQFRLDDAAIEEINRLDAALEEALTQPEAAFRAALTELLERVRALGAPLADDELMGSDVILPAPDATEDEVREMLTEEGLLPG